MLSRPDHKEGSPTDAQNSYVFNNILVHIVIVPHGAEVVHRMLRYVNFTPCCSAQANVR